MRKIRNYDVELKALNDKARALKKAKHIKLGELVVATGADALEADVLAGALLDVAQSDEGPRQVAWKRAGDEYFRRGQPTAPKGAARPVTSAPPTPDNADRYLLSRTRHDTRYWLVNRRERARPLIEPGGLIAKSGLVDQASDDRALIYGWLLELVDLLREPASANRLTLLNTVVLEAWAVI